jgi:hypothetical protein
MIQLIGFLLCTYMLVRGLDIGSRAEDRKSRTSAMLANLAGTIAVLGAIVFFLLFVQQGSLIPSFGPSQLN